MLVTPKSGQPLPKATRAFMESRFGQDFSQVRVHADSEAAQLNQALRAQAFTHGQDVYFGEGRYSPESGAGKRLLAHELTHTVQQKSQGTRVQRSLLTQEQLENRADRLFNAFEMWLTLSGIGTNVSTVFQALGGLTPDDVVALERIYQETYSPRRGGRSLVQDLLYEFENESPEDRHRVFSLIGRRVERPGEHERQLGQSSPFISAEPMLREVVPGTEVTYRLESPGQVLSLGTRIRSQWFVRYDPEALRQQRQRGVRPGDVVRGPAAGPLEFQWDFPGQHLVVLEVQIGYQLPTYYEYVQIVRGAGEHAVEAFEQHGTAIQPDIYLARVG